MNHIQAAQREVRSWLICGALSLVLGASAFAISNRGWLAFLGLLLFVLAGLYLIVRTIPFIRDVKWLIENDSPINMTLTFRGSERVFSPSYHAELRSTVSGTPEIVVFLGYQSWFSKVTEPISVKVWGAGRERGPVIIEGQFGVLVPAGPGAVTRLSS